MSPQIKATNLSEIPLKLSFDSKRSHQMIKLSKTPTPKLQIGCVPMSHQQRRGILKERDLGWHALFKKSYFMLSFSAEKENHCMAGPRIQSPRKEVSQVFLSLTF